MQKKNLYFVIEFLWWAITAVVTLAVLWPIWSAGIAWKFQTSNILFIVTLITFARHIFTLEYSLIAKKQVLKAGIMIAMVPYVFLLVSHLNGFQVYVEEHVWEELTSHLDYASRKPIESYMWNEMLFFGAGSILSAIVLAVRLFRSIWKQYNSEKHLVYQGKGR
jgi:hypothetical protein